MNHFEGLEEDCGRRISLLWRLEGIQKFKSNFDFDKELVIFERRHLLC